MWTEIIPDIHYLYTSSQNEEFLFIDESLLRYTIRVPAEPYSPLPIHYTRSIHTMAMGRQHTLYL